MSGRPRERSEFEAAMRRVFALSRADQFRAYHALREYLGEGVGRETARDQQIARRAEALDAMRRAAEWLKLDEAESLGIGDYRRAAAALGLSLSSSQIIRAWETWDQAKKRSAGTGWPRPQRSGPCVAPRLAGSACVRSP